MSTDGPDDPADDPFAFPADDDARRPAAENRRTGGDRQPDDDPFAFPDDDGTNRPPDAPGPDAAGPPRSPGAPGPRRRRRRGRVPTGDRAPADDGEAARVRAAADEAAAHARAVGGRWLLVAIGILVAVVVVTTVTGGRGANGGDVAAGERLPDFAAPLVDAPKLDREDVNLARTDDQGEAGRTAACKIRDPSAVTSCALLARGPLVLVVFSRGVDACVRAVDDLDVVRRRFPRVGALAVSLLGRHDTTGETARSRGWSLPVVYDRDGALGQVLGVPACPLVLFVRADGTVAQRIIGDVDATALERGIRRLLAPADAPTPTTPSVPGPPSAVTVDSTPLGR